VSGPETGFPVETLEQVEAEAWTDVYASASADVAVRLAIGVERVGDATVTVAAGVDILAYNRVLGLGRSGADPAEALDRAVDIYRRAGAARAFLAVAPDAGPAVTQRLHERGFALHNRWVKLARTVRPAPHVSTDLEVREIGPGEEARSFGGIFAAAFEHPSRLAPWVAGVVGRPGWHHYLAFDGPRPVATSAMLVSGDAAWIDFAATLPDARGRGAQSALLARRLEDAARLGVRTLVVEAGEGSASLRNLRRAGFEVAYERPNWLLVLD
jgi:GNAT superfamily N-acetyltransferase